MYETFIQSYFIRGTKSCSKFLLNADIFVFKILLLIIIERFSTVFLWEHLMCHDQMKALLCFNSSPSSSYTVLKP